MVDVIDRDHVERFIETANFTNKQGVPLPFGLRTPGDPNTDRVEQVLDPKTLGFKLDGKTVLDVGAYYGQLPVECMLRGAAHAVGVEIDPERCEIARKIAEFHGNTYDIYEGRIEDVGIKEKFDLVLFLNVIQFVPDPIQTLRTLAEYCTDTMVVEFCTYTNPPVLRHCYQSNIARHLSKYGLASVHAAILRFVGGKLPLVAVGQIENRRVFYFSERAFYNTFVVHNKIFSSVKFMKSHKEYRRLAICKM